MIISCKKCGHIWKYNGDSNYYVTCPRCLRKISILKLQEELNGEEPQDSEVSSPDALDSK